MRSLIVLSLILVADNCAARGIVHQSSGSIFLTDEAGRTTEVARDEINAYAGIALIGDTEPALSPDGSMVAYVATDWNIRIAHLDKSPLTKVSLHGGPGDSEYAGVRVLIAAWSQDSRKLLYHQGITHPLGDRLYSSKDLKRAGLVEGFILYDVESGARTPLPLLRTFEFWAPDSRSIVFSQNKEGRVEYLKMDLGVGTVAPWFSFAGDYPGQQSLSADGSKLALGTGSSSDGTSRIRVFDTGTRKFSNISPEGRFAEFQRPAFSPNGNSLAYVRYPTPGDLSQREWHVVNLLTQRRTKVKVGVKMRLRFWWLDNYRVGSAALNGDALVLDTSTGEIATYGPARAP